MDPQLQHRMKDCRKDNAKGNITIYICLFTSVVAIVFIVLYALELRVKYQRTADGNKMSAYLEEDITEVYKLNNLDCEQLNQTNIRLPGNFTVFITKCCEIMTNHSLLNTKYNELKTNYDKLMTNHTKLLTNCATQNGRMNKFVNDVSAGNISVYPSGWNWTSFQKSLYYFSNDLTNWTDAKDACASISCSSLVIVDDTDEQKFIERMKYKYWIGLRKYPGGHNFQWLNGAALNKDTVWADGEPNNEQTEFCVTKGSEFNKDKWNNDRCSVSHRRICEFKPECYVRKKFETDD